ncbi:MAG: ABC transporter ATP-binding protein [Ruminococcaceae bacterium]|nr:ABC transporter ATP-binding protein [Oscillospiraceae bacterium]
MSFLRKSRRSGAFSEVSKAVKYTRKTILKKISGFIQIPTLRLIASVFIGLFMTVTSIAAPYVKKGFVDDVIVGGNFEKLISIIISIAVIWFVRAVLSAIEIYLSKKVSYEALVNTRLAVFYNILEKDINDSETDEIGKYSVVLEKDCSSVGTFFSEHIVKFTVSVIKGTVYLTLMLLVAPYLAPVAIIPLVIIALLSNTVGSKFAKINRERYKVKSKTKTFMFDSLQKWKQIKLNTAEDVISKSYAEMLEPEKKLNSKWMLYYALRDFIYITKNRFVMKVLLYMAGGILIIRGQLTVGGLLMFMSYTEEMSAAIDSIIKSHTDLKASAPSFERLFGTFDLKKETRNQLVTTDPHIELKSVSFSYPSSNSGKIFDNVRCSFENGKKYLIKGKSGCGKSTLVKLIIGIESANGGKVTVGGIPIEKIKTESFFENVCVIMQESSFFNLTIRENMLFADASADEDRIREALREACLDEFVDSLPEKLDTVIGERGVKLSGGQKQRLAIARVLLRSPKTVILDEAKSALDPETEKRVMHSISERFKDSTIIVITHREEPRMVADYIYTVEDGKINATQLSRRSSQSAEP